MAAEYICHSCIKALRSHSSVKTSGKIILRQPRFQPHSIRRNFNSSSHLANTSSTVTTPSSSSKPASRIDVSSNSVAEANGGTDTVKKAANSTASQGQEASDKSEGIASMTARLRQEAQRMTSGLSREYMVYGAADRMYQICAKQADYSVPQALEPDGVIPQTEAGEHLGVGTGWWYSELGLRPIFNTWAQITMLYLYALLVRLRYLPEDEYKMFHQHINNTYFNDAEERLIRYHHINLGGIRQRYLKDLYAQWRGLILAYDEGLIGGDAVLATAVWRNIFNAREDVDVEAMAAVVSYLRRCLRMLDKMDDDQVRSVAVEWPGLEREKVLVRAESPQLKAPFVETSAV